jgi:exocyst complex component 4
MDGLWTNGYQETEERRPGGYGGFGASQPSNGVTSMRTTNGGSWNRNRSRSRGNAGKAEKRIEDVLYYIKQDWPFMTENECVPVQVALQLLDDSSLGLARRYDEFQDAQEQLQTALRAIVNEHHQGFNSSIGTFHQIQASIQSSHDRIRALKIDLVRAKTNLTSTKSEFQSLVTVSHTYDDTLQVLDLIEQVQQIPHQLEARISDKLFISAVDCLQEGLRLARSPELEDIGALSDMRVYLSNQELSLTDILLEELHNHLYLKSPYCEERWKTYAKIHRSNVQPDMVGSNSRQLYTFLDHLNPDSVFIEDTSRSPEADSFQYIQLLLEALSKLGHLEDAVEAVEQRLPVELSKVVERTTSEVQQRHPKSRAGTISNKPVKTFLDLNSDRRTSAIVLEDLLGLLYGRFEAIAESYRAFHEVIGGISKREDAGNTLRLTRAFKELWKLYQSAIRSLLHDYLSTDESVARGGQNAMSEGNVFRQQRDKNKVWLSIRQLATVLIFTNRNASSRWILLIPKHQI